eukprot:3028132-Pleurochrysis_carterae.AAC.1
MRAQSFSQILYYRTPTAPAIILLSSSCLNGLFLTPSSSAPCSYPNGSTATSLATSLASRAAS